MTLSEWLLLPAEILGQGMISLIRLYQHTLSPLIGRQCRYAPTCSQYFIDALRSRGVMRGTAMGLWRLLRCHPFSKGGYDPVDRPPRSGATGAE